MRTEKEQFAKAEIRFSKKIALKNLNLTDQLLAKNLFAQIRSQHPSIAKHKWLAFYFDTYLRFRNWFAFKNCNPQTLKKITGLAMAYSAESIIIVHQYTTTHSQASFSDYKCLTALFRACEANCIELLDFLIHSPQLNFSFKDEGYH